MRIISSTFAPVLIVGTMLAFSSSASAQDLAKQNETCLQCHSAMNPGLVEEWRASAHSQNNIGCYDCHRAEKTDADAFEHNGATIAVIVSPKDCGRCHQNEVDQQKGSHHAKEGEILASVHNFLGEGGGGPPAGAVGCS